MERTEERHARSHATGRVRSPDSEIIQRLVEDGFDVHRSTGVIHTVLGGVGGKEDFDTAVVK